MTTPANRVMERSITLGTGAIELAGAVTKWRTFDDAYSTGAEVTYCIETAAQFEIGRGVFTAPATLSRDTVLSSSSGGAKVSLTSASRVYITQAAEDVVTPDDIPDDVGLEPVAPARILGNPADAGADAVPVALTGAQVRSVANVDDGATKGTTTKRLVRAGGSSLVAGSGVASYSARVHRADTLAKLRAAGGFTGLSIATAAADATAHVIPSGPVDPADFDLGAGVACAVGVSASGLAVRVTDPTCISPFFILGRCDTDGTITVAPRLAHELDIRDFGAIADGVTDMADAFDAAMRSLSPTSGGAIHLPYGRYYSSRTLYIDRRCRVFGDGSGGVANSLDYAATTIVVPAGVTCFRALANGHIAPGVPGTNGSEGSEISGIRVVANGRNANTQTGTFTAGGVGTVVLDAAGDFVNGQLIEIPGAGSAADLARVFATTTSGSTTVVLTIPIEGIYCGIHVGMWIRVAGAFGDAKVRVASIPGTVTGTSFSITVSAAASASVSGIQVVYIPSAIAQIYSGGGTTTLLVDYSQGEDAAGVIIAHADAGFHSQANTTIRGCTAGISDFAFKGPGFLFSASSGWLPAPGYVGNCWHMHNCFAAANHGGGLIVQGQDTNAGICIGFNWLGSSARPYWGVLDQAGLGSTYDGCHVTGGYGYFTTSVVAGMYFSGCYTEGGTYNSLAYGTRVDGGVMDQHAGGSSWVGQYINQVTIGNTVGVSQFSKLQSNFDPDQGIRYRGEVASSGTIDLVFRPKRSGDGAPADFHAYGWHHAAQNASAGVMITDTANTVLTNMVTHAWDAGHVVLPRGAWIGGGTGMLAGTMSELATDTRYFGFWHDPPTAGYRDWFRGDRCVNSRLDAADNWIDQWVCTVGGNPGTWQAAALVIRQTAMTPAVGGAINSGDATTDTEIANMRSRIAELEAKLTAANILEAP